ncbi:hypothetical protein [Longimicrobium sp.]|uniref:hypothetical protein n=1 Tax=Longimicrobium sp. TaxID=2029185 RepID=UPI002F9565C6
MTKVYVEGRYEASGGELVVGNHILETIYGTPAILAGEIRPVENEAGTAVDAILTLQDPRGVTAAVEFYIVQLGVRLGPLAPTSHPAADTWRLDDIPLPPKPHILNFEAEVVRNDGQPNKVISSAAVDSDRVPNHPVVMEVRDKVTGDTVLNVDSDTDAESLAYRPIAVGAPVASAGAEVAIPPRGSQDMPYFGRFTVAADPDPQRFLVYGLRAGLSWNAGQTAQEVRYRDVTVEGWTAPPPVDDPAPMVVGAKWITGNTGTCGSAAMTHSVTLDEVINSASGGYGLRVERRIAVGSDPPGPWSDVTFAPSLPLSTVSHEVSYPGQTMGGLGTTTAYQYRWVVIRMRDSSVASLPAETDSVTVSVEDCP